MPNFRKLYTPWGETLDTEHPLQEYPRPQLVRQSYLNLNGPWDYAIRQDFALPTSFDGKIIVPFSPETLLSGVGRQLKSEEVLWYRRKFTLPEGFCPEGGSVLLHFGAVDQVADVYINGQEAAHHEGGYLPFETDITKYLQPGSNSIIVRVMDSLVDNPYAYGKQKYDAAGIWYTATSGIWQTVWLEAVPRTYIRRIKITPDLDKETVSFDITTSRPETVSISVTAEGREVAYGRSNELGQCTLFLSRSIPWSPEHPFLYQVRLTVGEDEVESYFALRKFSTVMHKGRRVLALNNRPYFHNGLLDQGYWSDGMYTAPSDEAMIHDIQTMKDLGFNMLRKHIKIEPLRWYYHCDRLGMLVWQDMVNGGELPRPMLTQVLPFLGLHVSDDHHYRRFGRESALGRRIFMQDMEETVQHLYNCPCIAVWVPFNEGWGQFDSVLVTARLRQLDPTRSIDHASGWHDQGAGDLKSEHVYYRPVKIKNDGARVLALTEFGGYAYPIKEHFAGKKEFGYRIYRTKAEYVRALKKLYEKEVTPLIESQGLSAAVYTEVSDVEDELNGILTFDRKVCKVDPADLLPVMQQLRFKAEPTATAAEE